MSDDDTKPGILSNNNNKRSQVVSFCDSFPLSNSAAEELHAFSNEANKINRSILKESSMKKNKELSQNVPKK